MQLHKEKFYIVLVKEGQQAASLERGEEIGHVCVFIHACERLLEGKALWQGVGACACARVLSGWRREWPKVNKSEGNSVREPARSLKYQPFCMCTCEYLDACAWVLFQVVCLSLQHILTQQAGMREREELRRAIEQSDRLLSKVRELEEQNTQLNKEKNEVATKYRAVSLLLCLFASQSLVLIFPLYKKPFLFCFTNLIL